MFSFENSLKNLIADSIVLAYEKIQDGNKDIADADGKPENVHEVTAPSQRRTRRTKAEIEAAKASEGKLALRQHVTYEELREEILNYITEFGSEKVLEVLGKFGVSKAQDLKDDQWAECFELIKALSREELIA